jgi:hypothetical protein
MTYYCFRMPVFLSFTLLRLAKSRFKQILDPDVKEEGRSALFVATNLLKRMSLVNNDICAKSVDFFCRQCGWAKPSSRHRTFLAGANPVLEIACR